MLSPCPSCLPIRTAAMLVGIIDVVIGPIGFLVTSRLSMNPHLEEEFDVANIHPEMDGKSNVTRSILMTALQGLVFNEWMAFMIFYPPLLLTFLVGLELLISVHQRNYCVAKLSLILNYILVGFLLILAIVSLANGLRVDVVLPFIFFSTLQAYFLWIVFQFAMSELKYPGVLSNGVYGDTTVIPGRLYDENDDLNL